MVSFTLVIELSHLNTPPPQSKSLRRRHSSGLVTTDDDCDKIVPKIKNLFSLRRNGKVYYFDNL